MMLATTASDIEAAAIPVLSDLFDPDDFVELAAFRNDGQKGGGESKMFRLGDALGADRKEFCDWAARHNDEHRGVAFGVQPRKSTTGSGRGGTGTNADVAVVRTLFADVDYHDEAAPDPELLRIELARRLTDSQLPDPTGIMWTGGGFAVVWRPEEPLPLSKFKPFQEDIAQRLQSDSVKALRQVLRVPGTYNRKPKYPDANRLVRVVEWTPGHRVPVAAFSLKRRRNHEVTGEDSDFGDFTLEYLKRGSSLNEGGELVRGTVGRNNSLLRAACDFHGCRRSQAEAEGRLLPIAVASGMSHDEAMTTIQSAYSKPRQPERRRAAFDHHDPDKDIVVVNNTPVGDASDKFRDALVARNATSPHLYVFNGRIACVSNWRRPGDLLMIRAVKRDALAYHVENDATPYKVDKNGEAQPVPCPEPIINHLWHDLVARPCFPLLKGLSPVQLVRPDGSILSEPGYDPATCMIFDPPPGFTPVAVSEAPTEDERARAKLLLEEPFQDFPFDTPASRANFFALLFLAFARLLIDGCTPLHLITAPMAGSGKTLLARIVSLVFLGGQPWLLHYSGNGEAFGKRILSILLSGGRIILMDNIDEMLRSDKLAMLLTSREYSDRQLGRNDEGSTRTVFNDAIYIATGNNLSVGGDMPRRCVWISLNPRQANPERRKFKIPNIEQWIVEHRPDLIWSVLTLIRSWINAGRPAAPNTPTVGSFQEYANVLGGILAHAGIPGFYENTDAMNASANDEACDWDHFLLALYERSSGQPVAVRQVIKWVETFREFTEALPFELAQCRQNAEFAKLVGQAFKRRREVIHGNGLSLQRAGEDRTGVALWRVCAAEGSKPPEAKY